MTSFVLRHCRYLMNFERSATLSRRVFNIICRFSMDFDACGCAKIIDCIRLRHERICARRSDFGVDDYFVCPLWRRFLANISLRRYSRASNMSTNERYILLCSSFLGRCSSVRSSPVLCVRIYIYTHMRATPLPADAMLMINFTMKTLNGS